MTLKRGWKGTSNLTWGEIVTRVEILSNRIKKTGFEFDRIATISRGGLVPARLIADYFGIKKIIVDPKKIPKKTLFVDDIYDSGDTFKKIIPLVQTPSKFLYATIVARKGVKYPSQLVYAKKTIGKEYVVFPWDRLEFERTRKPAKD